MSKPESQSVIGAACWMVGSLFSFSLMAVGARELSAGFATFQLLAVRSFIGLMVISLLLCLHGWGQLKTAHFKTHLIRNVTHFGGQFGWFFAIAWLPLATVFAIEFTVPLWTLMFAALLLKERVTRSRVLAVVFGVSGILVIFRPGWSVLHPASLAILAAALAFGLSHTLTKKLSGQDRPLCILFFMMSIQLGLSAWPAAASWVQPAAHEWLWFFAIGLTGLSGHYCMVRAFGLADASVVVPLDFLRLPFIALVAWLLYDEALDYFLIVGAGLILTGNFIGLHGERLRKGVSKPPPLPEAQPGHKGAAG